MDGWQQVRPPIPLSTGNVPSLISAVAIDSDCKLVWTVRHDGLISSYFGLDARAYTRFVNHRSFVTGLTVFKDNIVSLSSEKLCVRSKRGLLRYNLDFLDYSAMISESKGSNLVFLAGLARSPIAVDLEARKLVMSIKNYNAPQYLLLRSRRLLGCGIANGQIELRDPRSLELVVKIDAHSGYLSDFDMQGNYLVSCGYSIRNNEYIYDSIVNTFDLRTNKLVMPLTFAGGANFLRIHPRVTNLVAVSSTSGKLSFLDIHNSASSTHYQVRTLSQINTMSVSDSGDSIFFTDTLGYLHVWSPTDEPDISKISKKLEFADLTPSPCSLQIDQSNLNSIGLPYYKEKLLSALPESILKRDKLPSPLNFALLASATRHGNAFYIANLFHQKNILVQDNNKEFMPKFHSESEQVSTQDKTYFEDIENQTPLEKLIPRCYKRPVIQYSKFGVEDFDFQFFNKTQFAGLESDIRNSHLNAIIQMLFFTVQFRILAINHGRYPCELDNCLLCELGFLFEMLEQSKGLNCQASNFLNSLNSLPNKSGINTCLDKKKFGDVAQQLLLFLLGNCARASQSAEFLKIFANWHCNCLATNLPCYVFDIIWPNLNFDNLASITFANIISENMRRIVHCDNCRMENVKRTLPLTLLMKTNITNPIKMSFWIDQGWPPKKLSFKLVNNRFICLQISNNHNAPGSHLVYELRGMVCEIENKHLIFLSKPEKSNTWFLFNDFLVKPIPEEHVFKFFGWKKPIVLCYEQVDQSIVVTRSSFIDKSLLYRDICVTLNRNKAKQRHKPLESTEVIDSKTIVAFDSEFISLQKENIEVKSDGTRTVISPKQFSLARISIIRTQGELQGVSFIDDYVVCKENVDDYLTEYSGIYPQDLDLNISEKTLLPLKFAYKKLKILVDLGCKFIGHGLAKDFRIINIVVNPNQILDTVDLFYLKERQRKLSLRFLAWMLFKEDIQIETHDSIEDALTAMKLYNKYKELVAENKLDETLIDIYRLGRKYNFKPPNHSMHS